MNFSIERPFALYGILFLIPVVIYSFFAYKKTFSALLNLYEKSDLKNAKKRTVFKILFRCIAWCMLILAYAGISWGTISSPVQKNGNAVSLVFDISYSMMARDMRGGLSRLEGAASYARGLLDCIEGVPVSAVIAKGDGVVAVPLTEDRNTVHTLLDSLSPTMLTSAGSNLGDGILAALKSFPKSVSKMPIIWLFTDGEETEDSLLSALNISLRQGVSVIIIGFGSERESEITAGDGKTLVKTALRADKIKHTVDLANKRNFGEQGFSFFKGAYAKYINAVETSSALGVLSSINDAPIFSEAISEETISKEAISVFYESHSVERQGFFILLAIVFFALSFFASEFNLDAFNANAKLKNFFQNSRKFASLFAIISFSFASCSNEFRESKKILEGTWNWMQKDFDNAVADFSQSFYSAEQNNDELIKQYALYALSATYIMQNENEASLEKINALSKDAPNNIRFAAFYNAGIISHRKGEYEKAIDFFKQALLVDSANTSAKINLELAQNQYVQQAQEGEQNLTGASENAEKNSALEKSVFNRIRENEQKQWKNFQSEQSESSALDY